MEKKYTLLKFFAVWCGPCAALTEALEENAENFANILPEVEIQEVDVDENEDLCVKHKVRNIPFLVLVDNETNETVMKHVGGISYFELVNKLNTSISEYENS